MKALVFNIQRYSIHDGGGIRTLIFFKGCPLHCPWCCNPESQSFKIEESKIEEKCIHCSKCSHNEKDCPSGAITIFGKYMSIEELVKEAEKDMVFYNTSGGGVTLSGGEVLSQADFASELLKRLKDLGINTAIETSGQGSRDNLLKIAEYTDLILFDLKIMNKDKARNVIGADIELIKNNLKALVKNDYKVIPRIPLIPGYTMDDENIKEIAEFVLSLGLKQIHILPFHQYGQKKYEYINKEYSMIATKPPSEKEVNSIKEKLELNGLNVNIGGL